MSLLSDWTLSYLTLWEEIAQQLAVLQPVFSLSVGVLLCWRAQLQHLLWSHSPLSDGKCHVCALRAESSPLISRTQSVCEKEECQLLLSSRMSRVNSSSDGIWESLNPVCQETQWGTRRSVSSWRTVCCARHPGWSRSWSCSLREGATLEESLKDWAHSTVSPGSSGAGSRVRRKECWRQSILNRLQPPFPAQTSRNPQGPLCQSRRDISGTEWHLRCHLLH